MLGPPNRHLLSRRRYIRRQLRHVALSGGIIAGSLAIGAVGYHAFEGLNWLDSVYAAAMILTTMGPACELRHDSTKVFVTLYSLFSVLVFVSAATVVASPLLHRMFHIFHVQEAEHQAAPHPHEHPSKPPE